MLLNNFCGIDVGCTNIKMMAVVDNVPYYKILPSGDHLKRNELISIIHDFYFSFHNDFDGMGIAFSGCTSDSLKVERTTLQCLSNLSVSDFLDLDCGKVLLINDSNAATLAGTLEYPNSNVLVAITNGTGIGCGVSINGSLFTGGNGFLREIYGNPIVDESGNIVKIGKICSGSKILKSSKQVEDCNMTSAVISRASIYFGTLLVNVIHFYNPDVIYFSGGGFDFDGFLENSINFAKKSAYPHLVKGLTFAKSTYEKYTGCIGAMVAVSQQNQQGIS